jgi:hypothetical protein
LTGRTRGGGRWTGRGAGLAVAAGLLLLGGPSLAHESPSAPVPAPSPGDIAGIVWTGPPGITESVAEIMAREAREGGVPPPPEVTEPALGRLVPPGQNPLAPPVSQWPPPEKGPAPAGPAAGGPASAASAGPAAGAVSPLLPQTVGTSFKAISLASESSAVPPDSMGDVGPTQILAMANGRIKVFDKTGVLGGLNVSDGVFFNSVRGGAGISDPQVRYDRLSGRWFVTEITTTVPNKVMIAVSSSSTITSTSSFTFFAFQHDLVGVTPNEDTNGFADYDSMGVDRFALYIGVNVFNSSGTAFLGSTGFVVNKAALIAGTLTVTAFRQIANAFGSGLLSPRGVSNDDPAATEGYFAGVDNLLLSQVDIRRITNPGGTPAISPQYTVFVPTTTSPLWQVVQGSANDRRLDSLDDRLFSATVRRNKITGEATLWTAHNIEVDASGVGVAGGGRNGSRWYEIGSLTTTPVLRQAGTLFDGATDPRGFWIPSVTASGQGHMALGSSYASTHDFAGVATAGRLRTDIPGSTRAATLAQASATAYNVQSTNPQRWGDYSQTVVDPTDDMTLWTFQEWCDLTNSWGVQVVQLKAPPPATPASAFPSSVCGGMSTVAVTITGTSVAGSEFFDPGPDAGGPGYPRHLSASVSGSGVSVTGTSFTDPTHVTLTLSTIGAANGPRTVTVTNPDGQAAAAPVLSIGPFSAPPASGNTPVCAGGTLQLTATGPAGATYSWTGPNGFASSQQNPAITGVTAAAAGTYNVTYSLGGCTSTAAAVPVTVIADGASCSDGNACTQTDTCQAGTCVGANPVLCAPGDQCNDAGVCNPATGVCSPAAAKPDGTLCDDGAACTTGDACRSGLCVSTLALAPAAGSPLAAGTMPFSAAAADFNLDGRVDLAVADSGANVLTILLGDGTGGFAAAPGSPVAAGPSPIAVAAGDFNRDGKPDLAVADNGGDGVTILLGNGAGGFAPAAGSPFPTGSMPFAIAVADFNLDNRLDLAAANSGSDNVTILLGNGAGGFAAAPGSPVAAGSAPSALAAGDLNLDGKPDLAVANNGSANVSILLGDGAGGFQAAAGSPVGTGLGPFPLVVADLDLDGKPDLAVANNSADSVTILLGNGAGGFTPAAGSPVATGSTPAGLVAADFNLDGRPDLAVADSGSNDVTILLGGGTGRFAPASGSPVAAGSSPAAAATGDFNLDGKPDLAVPNQFTDDLTVLLDAPGLAPDGTACSDGNACTAGDTCLAGLCHGGPPPDADADGHVAATCGGDDCNDADSQVWHAPVEVTNILVTTAAPAALSWDSQGAQVGPGTTYDLVSGPLVDATNPGFASAVCLQSGGPPSFGDARPNPAAGTGYWYLARGRNGCGVGTFGSAARDSTIAPCP